MAAAILILLVVDTAFTGYLVAELRVMRGVVGHHSQMLDSMAAFFDED